MKKSDLKKLIKPVVKECINEVLLEEGLLSSIVSEVTKGLQAAPIIKEQAEAPPPRQPTPPRDYSGDRKKLLDAIGADAYNGVDLFEGTTPLSTQHESRPGNVDLGDSNDSGVDISSLMGGATKMWDLMK